MSDYYTTNIYTSADNEEKISTILHENSLSDFVYESPYIDNPNFNSRFCFYNNSIKESNAILEAIKDTLSELSQESYMLTQEFLKAADWQEEWKKYFEPIYLDKIAILPAWESDIKTDTQLPIYIDPGMAFGSGAHATTKNCLRLMEHYLHDSNKVLDFGAGSAILAIAASKLGATNIDAVEIDPEAIENAKKNIHFNKCKINTYVGSIEAIPNNNYDTIIANITATVLMELLPQILDKQTTVKHLLLSGINIKYKEQFENFLTTLPFNLIDSATEGEWSTYYLLHN